MSSTSRGNCGKLTTPIAVRIGVTGHRALADESLLAAKVRQVLAKLDKILSHTPHRFVVISPLAEGADRLVAGVVLNWPVGSEAEGPRLEALLPLRDDEYLKDFETEESKQEFRQWLARSASVQTVPPARTRAEAYRRVGEETVLSCELLIAIWDGKPAGGQGGTAEVVEYARQIGRSIFWVHCETGAIREERRDDRSLESLGHLDTCNWEEVNELDAGIGRELERLERHASEAGLEKSFLRNLRPSLLPHYVRADSLALRYQRRYINAGSLMYAFAAATLATVAVLAVFRIHHAWYWLEVVEISAILVILAWVHVRDWHRKWIDYRFLAERLRAALFLRVAGISTGPLSPPPHLRVSHRPDDWVVRVFTSIWNQEEAATGDRASAPFEPLRSFLGRAWIEHQVSFYRKTGDRLVRKYKLYTRLGLVLFGLTLLAATCHSFGLGESQTVFGVEFSRLLEAAAIILPAVGAAIAGVRAHREYHRNAEKYQAMARQLSKILGQIDQAADMQALTQMLGHANHIMLRENQDWRFAFLMQVLHPPA